MALYDGIFVVVPCYNADNSVETLFERLLQLIPPSSVIAVDDGSTDSTAQRLRRFDIHICSHHINHGKGAALRTGFEKALALGAAWVLTLDADLQHLPEEAAVFALSKESADVVIGSRRNAFASLCSVGQMPKHRRLSNRLSSLCLSIVTGQQIEDAQCGFRLYSRAAAKSALKSCKKNGYMFETECLLLLTLLKFRIGFVPISVVYNQEKSYMRPVRETLHFFHLLLTFSFSSRLITHDHSH